LRSLLNASDPNAFDLQLETEIGNADLPANR
jgi:hypothetical protein